MVYADAQAGGTVYALAAAISITLAGTVSKGDLIGYNSGWVRADGDAHYHARMVALESGVTGDVIKAAIAAEVGGRLSGMTAGSPLYTGTAAGKYQESASTAAEVVGYAITATEALIMPVKTEA